MIVEIAVNDSSDFEIIIVAEDIDVLVILTARAKIDKEIYFLKLGKQKEPSTFYSSKSLDLNYPNSAQLILFAHCFTGCDTTSAFYNKGKKKFLELLEKREDLREKAKIFYNSESQMDDILKAGTYCTILMYGSGKDIQLAKLNSIENIPSFLEKMRYASFIKATTKNSAVKLSSLVPTIDALHQHLKRVYYQIQVWLGNKNINSTDWGWIKKDNSLQPIRMMNQPAPQELLKMIFCKCKCGCGATCTCRKLGLFCNPSCGTCSGDNCLNCPPIVDQEEQEELNSDEE